MHPRPSVASAPASRSADSLLNRGSPLARRTRSSTSRMAPRGHARCPARFGRRRLRVPGILYSQAGFPVGGMLRECCCRDAELYQVRQSACGSGRAQVLYTRRQQVPITIIRLESTRHVYSTEEIQTVLEFFQKFLDVNRPDVMLTYGGDPITMGMIAEAKRREIPVVFVLHNFAYTNPRVFSNVDYCIVASEFAPALSRQGGPGLRHLALRNGLGARPGRGPRTARLSRSSTPAPKRACTLLHALPTSSDAAGPTFPCWLSKAVARASNGRVRSGPLSLQSQGHASYHGSSDILARDQDRPYAFTLVGESTPRGHRGHDQRDPRHRLQSRRHPGDPRRKRVCTSSAESPDALDKNRALRRGSRALGRDDHPPVG